jgi:hypothetical protein
MHLGSLEWPVARTVADQVATPKLVHGRQPSRHVDGDECTSLYLDRLGKGQYERGVGEQSSRERLVTLCLRIPNATYGASLRHAEEDSAATCVGKRCQRLGERDLCASIWDKGDLVAGPAFEQRSNL